MPLRIYNRNKVCCVKQCKSGIDTLYKFPHNPTLQNKWKSILNIYSDINENFLVCSNHFQEKNFFGIKNLLRKNAFPDKNLPDDNVEEENSIKKVTSSVEQNHKTNNDNLKISKMNENTEEINIENLQDDNNFAKKHKIFDENTEGPLSPDFHGFDLSNIFQDLENEQNLEDSVIIKDDILNITDTVCDDTDFKMLEDTIQPDLSLEEDLKEIAFLTSETKYFYSSLKTTDELQCWTGIENFEIFYCLVNEINKFETKSIILSKNYYTNLLPIKELLTIVMVHIRTNLNFLRMSTLFNISQDEILNCFKIFVPLVCAALVTENNWPSKRLGKSFCLILEPFEFLLENNRTEVKDNSTVKALIGFDNIGTIIWTSNIYSQKASYNEICIKEGIYEKLRRIDTVIARKHIGIDNVFKKLGILCYTDDRIIKKRIGNLREDIRNEINLFEIFQKPISHSILYYLDDILSVTCFIINMK